MKKQRFNYKVVFSTVIMLLIVILILINNNLIKTAVAQTMNEQISNITEEKYGITDTNEPNSIKLTDYAKKYYGKNIQAMYEDSFEIKDNDDIIKIIPEELFKKEGVVQHIGKEYGFFIETRKPFGNMGMFVSTVIIIDVSVEDDMFSRDSMSFLKIKLSPIFQADFSYVENKSIDFYGYAYQDSTSNSFIGNKFGYKMNMKFHPNFNVDDGFIIPIPTNTSVTEYAFEFKQHNKYYLTDVANQTSLYNVNQLNPHDEGYLAQNDRGSFFTLLDFEYKGSFLKEGSTKAYDVGSVSFNAASFAFDMFDAAVGLKSVFKAIPIAGQIISVVDIISSINKISNDLSDKKLSEEKKISYTPNYNTKDLQIANGGLNKDAVISIKSDTEKTMLFGTNDFCEFKYQVNSQDMTVDTRYATMINIGVVSVVSEEGSNTKFGQVYKSTNVFSGNLKNHVYKDYKEIPQIQIKGLDKADSLTILPNFNSMREIVPEFSGNYNIIINNSYAKFEIFEVKEDSSGYMKIKEKIGFVHRSEKHEGSAKVSGVYLDKNKQYLLVVDLKENVDVDNIYGRYGLVDLEIEMAVENVGIGTNDFKADFADKYLKFDSFISIHYRLTLNQNNLMIHLLDENFAEISSSFNNELLVTLKKDKTYYFKIVKTSSEVENIRLLIKDEMIVFLTNIENISNSISSNIIVSSDKQVVWPIPTKSAYNFAGWWTSLDNQGIEINNENIVNYLQPMMILLAKWKPIVYTINYVENGGYGIDNGQYIIEDRVILNQNITKINFVFGGWFENSSLTGEEVEFIPAGSSGARTFYAKWINEKFNIYLDVNAIYTDGEKADINILTKEVSYIDFFILPVPKLGGFVFMGWYSGAEQITLNNGQSFKIYSKVSNEDHLTVKAKWEREKYYIKINKNGSFKWLTKNGRDFNFSDDKNSIESEIGMCPQCYILSATSKVEQSDNNIKNYLYKDGHKYKYMIKDINDSSKLACWTGTEFGEAYLNDAEIEIFAFYEIEKEFKIYIEGYNPIYKDFGQNITYPIPIKDGYTFKEYLVSTNIMNNFYLDTHLGPNKNFDYITMPDLSINCESDGNAIYLTPKFTPNKYVVSFSNFAATAEITKYPNMEVFFGDAYNNSNGNAFPIISKEGYVFSGWYDSVNGDEIKIVNEYGCINEWNVSRDCKLYAKLLPEKYQISFDKQGGEGGVESIGTLYDNYVQLFMNSTTQKTGYNEFLQYMDIAPIINKYGLIEYTISFDIKAPVAGSIAVYLQNGSDARYKFEKRVNIKTEFTTQYVTVTPVVSNLSLNQAILAFYGGYGTGRVITVRNVKIEIGSAISSFETNEIVPNKTGFTFEGYWENPNGAGKQYYDKNMSGLEKWTQTSGATLFAKWKPAEYKITFDKQGGSGGSSNVIATYLSDIPFATKSLRLCLIFDGYYSGTNGTGKQYYDYNMVGVGKYLITADIILYAKWKILNLQIDIVFVEGEVNSDGKLLKMESNININCCNSYSVSAPNFDGYEFVRWDFKAVYPKMAPYIIEYSKSKNINITYDYVDKEGSRYRNFSFYAIYKSNCIAEGSLITLADGTQKSVETLTLEDRLLVWNMHTGQFDSAPILFIDSDAERTFEVINLSFSDGTTVKVIDEHGFWNVDLNQYVFLRNDASQYIGHWFNKQTMDEDGNMIWTAVQLTDVVIANEVTTAYSPVTYGHLNYYVNGMLSMPGATEGLINIFDVDAETMQINQEAYLADIEQYGLFTYEEFNAITEVEEEVFLAFDGQYLKVAIGKGLITIEQIETLLARYIELLM